MSHEHTSQHERNSPFAARPIVWLYVAAVGLALTGIGVAIDAHRHDHGAASAGIVSRSSPGIALAIAGCAVAAIALLTALTLLALRDAPSPESVARRAVGVTLAWVTVSGAGIAALTYTATSDLSIGHVHDTASPDVAARPAPTIAVASPTVVPGVNQRLTLTGAVTQDGSPLQADFIGADVVRDGLVSACQVDIPHVDAGRYQITVMAEAESSGCGAPGGEIVLWTFVNNQFEYSAATMRWPDSTAANFDAAFSSANPNGARTPYTGFKGHVVRTDGTRLGGGRVVEAYIGDTLCGRTTVRREPEAWFTLFVSGPQAPGCAKDGRITFRVDGAGAGETATNDLRPASGGLTIELTVE